jgi:hypothetical protein
MVCLGSEEACRAALYGEVMARRQHGALRRAAAGGEVAAAYARARTSERGSGCAALGVLAAGWCLSNSTAKWARWYSEVGPRLRGGTARSRCM